MENMLSEIGKALIFFGLIIVLLGLVLAFLPSLRVGSLPGDIFIKRDNWSIFIPVTTSILLSLFLTLFLWILTSWRR